MFKQPNKSFKLILSLIAICLLFFICILIWYHPAKDPLPSWNNTATKQKIIKFVTEISDPESSSYVPVNKRIAVFDNDGTLICEKPTYVQIAFAYDWLKNQAIANPKLKNQEIYKAALTNDYGYMRTMERTVNVVTTTFQGRSQKEFTQKANQFVTHAIHPRFKTPYTQVIYKPMLELVDYLHAHGFKVYIVSGLNSGFIRSFAEKYLHIDKDKIIGTSIKLSFELDNNGNVKFIRQHAILKPANIGKGKAENIQRNIGKKPLLAFGNSSGDIQMFELTESNKLPHLVLFLHHDDAKREYAYDKAAEILLKIAAKHSWLEVSMQNDFRIVFN
jgi:hypothetical protein